MGGRRVVLIWKIWKKKKKTTDKMMTQVMLLTLYGRFLQFCEILYDWQQFILSFQVLVLRPNEFTYHIASCIYINLIYLFLYLSFKMNWVWTEWATHTKPHQLQFLLCHNQHHDFCHNQHHDLSQYIQLCWTSQ